MSRLKKGCRYNLKLKSKDDLFEPCQNDSSELLLDIKKEFTLEEEDANNPNNYFNKEFTSTDSNIIIKEEVDMGIFTLPSNTTQESNVDQTVEFCSSAYIQHVSLIDEKFSLCDGNKENNVYYTDFISPSLLSSLYEYIEDDIISLDNISKLDQLKTFLIKLLKNEDSKYVAKSYFPPAFIGLLNVLFGKLKAICGKPSCNQTLPSIFTEIFEPNEEVVIVNIIKVCVKDDNSLNENVVQFIIGYNVIGQVFFVSSMFQIDMSINSMLLLSGILEEISPTSWIIVVEDGDVYKCKAQNDLRKESFNSIKLKNRIKNVINRLTRHFTILICKIPYFMSIRIDSKSILEKIVWICCMLLNMSSKYVSS